VNHVLRHLWETGARWKGAQTAALPDAPALLKPAILSFELFILKKRGCGFR
jgi:hypothetical protein